IRLAVEIGELKQFDRGVYYLPEYSKLLQEGVPISADLVIQKKYYSDDTEVFGFESGLGLQYKLHVSNQMPFTLEITTNRETNRRRSIKPYGGYKEIVLKRPRIPVTSENVGAMETIDLIETCVFEALNDYELECFQKKYLSTDSAVFLDCLAAYPRKTMQKYLMGVNYGYIPA
ncbi:hypothetical protein, partial [uncultured Adlercreutzia sp.]|uniref:hypothetical protein n=1 Tax=uncultured Adlercreutzia sp. TaxID=875803 RepID=UPI0026F3FB26